MDAPCLEWPGRRQAKGYAVMCVGGRDVLVHRLVWMITNGRSIPDGMVVRHSCDNRPCIQASHLQLGTPADNSRDMVERGRSMRTSTCPHGHPKEPGRKCPTCRKQAVRRHDWKRRGVPAHPGRGGALVVDVGATR